MNSANSRTGVAQAQSLITARPTMRRPAAGMQEASIAVISFPMSCAARRACVHFLLHLRSTAVALQGSENEKDFADPARTAQPCRLGMDRSGQKGLRHSRLSRPRQGQQDLLSRMRQAHKLGRAGTCEPCPARHTVAFEKRTASRSRAEDLLHCREHKRRVSEGSWPLTSIGVVAKLL